MENLRASKPRDTLALCSWWCQPGAMTLIACATSFVSGGHEVDRPEIVFPDGYGTANFLVTTLQASSSFIRESLPGPLPAVDVTRLGRWAVSVSTYQRASTASFYCPLVVFGFGPSRAVAELPGPLPFDGRHEVRLLGRPTPPGFFEFTVHIGGISTETAGNQ
jgi:hypothetical protein